MYFVNKPVNKLLRSAAFAILAACPIADRASTWDDLRAQELVGFFKSHDCPQPYYVTDYLRAADTYGVDYRLLPAISVLESTCGKYQRLNNYWGWNSARTGFSSVARGIDFVTRQLTEGPFERATLDAKLYTYNPYRHYVKAARSLIAELEEPQESD